MPADMEWGNAACRHALQIIVPLDVADVKSYAWLHEVELTWVAANCDGTTTALCRSAAQADRLRVSLNAAISRP